MVINSSRTKSSGPVLRSHQPSTTAAARRSASPTRVNLFTSTPLNQSFRYSIDNRSVSPNQSVAVSSKKPSGNKIPDSRRRCMCSPTTHPGSFRCSLHKNVANPHGQGAATTYSTNNGLNMRRSAMTNSLVRIGVWKGVVVDRSGEEVWIRSELILGSARTGRVKVLTGSYRTELCNGDRNDAVISYVIVGWR
ncbi:hypothetical protein Bca52824_094723 [Brassica carinata]|uniref:Uncharacterized protein n=1 Tax=Brassica carinata TaxID=52824 RepID=A0A8X7P3V3_BRACI|nr:hypothetical protein Bca52824_094723 [Brassica carinata]